jgi:hypothetical protein
VPTLQQEEYQEVAQLINSAIKSAFNGVTGTGLDFNVDLNSFRSKGGTSKAQRKFIRFYDLIKKEIGYDARIFNTLGVTAVYAIGAVRYLVQIGRITPEQAEGFLVTKYPEAGFTGGSFNDVRLLPGYEAQGDTKKSMAQGDPEEGTVVEKAKEVQDAVAEARGGTLVPAVSPAGNLPIFLRQVPEEIPASQELQEVLDDLTRQVQLNISKVANGRINLQPGSIDGSVIKPGTLAYSALDPIDAQSRLQEFPDPSQAILCRITPDPVLDVWAEDEDNLQTATGQKFNGPRRVWRVSSFDVPSGFKPTLGPLRYRLIVDDVQFGMGSVRYTDPGVTNQHEIRYGIVIRGLPGFHGRPVDRILYCGYTGFSPSSLNYVSNGVTVPDVSPDALFEKTAETKFRVNPPTMYTSFFDANVGGDLLEVPDQDYLDDIDGLTFMLVNGRTAEEVYAQLNSLPSVFNAHIGGKGAGPGDSCPSGLEITSLAGSSVTVISPSGLSTLLNRTFDGYTTVDPLATTAFSLTGAAAPVVVEGVPFLMRDCERMRITDERFAVQVMVWPPRTLNYFVNANGALNYGRHPSHWYTRGVRIDKQNDRQVAIDIVVV